MEGRYSWTENEWELEVTVPVPAGTRKEEVLFKASPTTLQLALAPNTTGAPLLAVSEMSMGWVVGVWWGCGLRRFAEWVCVSMTNPHYRACSRAASPWTGPTGASVRL